MMQRHAGNHKKLFLIAGFCCILAAFLIFSPAAPTRPAPEYLPLTPDADGSFTYEGPLHITGIMAGGQATGGVETGSVEDWVELTNTGEAALHLEGFGLSVRADKISFLFPYHVLEPGEHVLVYTSGQALATPGKPYHARFHLPAMGAALYLFSNRGRAIERVLIPPLDGQDDRER